MERVHWIAVAAGLAGFILGNLFFMVFLLESDREAEIAEAVEAETVMLVATGQFTGADAVRRAVGRLQVLETEKGQVLRFEDFRVMGLPGLKVALVRGAVPIDMASASRAEVLDLGMLKAPTGAQNYALPKGVQATDFASVLIWSRDGGGLLGVASIRALSAPVAVDAHRPKLPPSVPKPSAAMIKAPVLPPKPEEEEEG